MAILQIKGQTQGTGTITFTMPSTDEQSTVTLPAKSGTIALTSDIVHTDISNLATKTELSSGLASKAEKVHTHTEADITGLTDKLGTFATTDALTSGLASKANSTHSHTIQQITNLESVLSGKAPLANPTFTGTVTGTFKGNLTGNVTGNASSATKATQDASGNVIASTYLKSSVAASTYATKAESYTKNEIDAKVSSVYKYKGTVASKANLPATNQVVGDVYNVTDTGKNFAWDGNAWDDLGGTVDLTAYAKTADVNSKLATKLNVTTYTSDKATFAIASTVNAELDKKLNTADAFTRTTADGLYLGKTAKATTAGTADKAIALNTARTIGITGAVTGTATSFNGTANININATAVDGKKVSVFTGATASANGAVGAVPAPAMGAQTKYLRGDGTWQTPPNTTYGNMTAATANVAGKAGLVPAPAAGAQAKYLRGDGTWQYPTNTDTKVVQTVSTTAGEFPILTKDSTAVTTVTTGAKFASAITANHSTGIITAKGFKGSLTGNASTATKATQDASGNTITSTYATKTEVNAKAPLANPTFTGTVTISGGTFKGNLTGTADSAKSANAVTWANVSGKPGLIPTRGNAGTITTSETIANLQTVNASAPRSMKASSGATVTLQQGGAEAWITVIACAGAVTVNLGSGWAWSGSAPTLGKGLLTCAWYGSFGIVNFMKWGS